MEAHHGPVIYYIPAILAGFFPWSVLLPLALLDLVQQLRHGHAWQRGYQFVACWTAVYIGFFSCGATKLPSYVLPAYPALALMAAACLVRWLSGEAEFRRVWMRLWLGTEGAVGAGMLIGLPIAAHYLLPGEQWLGLVGLILLAGAAVAWVMLARQQRRLVAITMAATAVAFAVAIFGVASVRISGHHNNTAMLAHIRQHSAADFQLSTFRYSTPSLVYYANQRVTLCSEASEVREFFQKAAEPFLLTPADRLEELQGHLPGDAVELLRQRRFLRRGDLVLIGRAPVLARSDGALLR
jgi:4-amino-4-deoxy-L-arabinose transferase-like glycosyltransferase